MSKKHPVKTGKPASLSSAKSRIDNWLKGLEEDIGRPLSHPHNGSLVYLLLDCSSSMAVGTKLAQAKNGAFSFSQEAIEKRYAVGLIQFSSIASHLTEPLNDTSNLKPHIDGIKADGSTNMADAIRMAIGKLQDRFVQRVIVIVTDGMPDSREAALSAANDAKSKGIDIITIGTDDADTDFLRQIASRTDLVVSVNREQLQEGITSAARLLPGKRE